MSPVPYLSVFPPATCFPQLCLIIGCHSAQVWTKHYLIIIRVMMLTFSIFMQANGKHTAKYVFSCQQYNSHTLARVWMHCISYLNYRHEEKKTLAQSFSLSGSWGVLAGHPHNYPDNYPPINHTFLISFFFYFKASRIWLYMMWNNLLSRKHILPWFLATLVDLDPTPVSQSVAGQSFH